MSGETAKAESGWSTDTLKAYMERVVAEMRQRLVDVMDERDRRYEDRFTAMDEKTSLALTASEKAVTKAETATEKRFDAVNEFRGTLSDQAANLLPRMEADIRFTALEKDLAATQETVTRMASASTGGRSVLDTSRANLGALVGLVALLVVLYRAFTGH